MIRISTGSDLALTTVCGPDLLVSRCGHFTGLSSDVFVVIQIRIWLLALIAFVLLFLGIALAPIPVPASPYPLFWFAVIVTALCGVFALVLVAVAQFVRQPELVILGSGLYAASLFPLVHALTIPGVIWSEETAATSFGAWVGLPLGLVIALPALGELAPWRRWAFRHPKIYGLGTLVGVTLAASFLLASPDSVPTPKASAWWSLAGAAAAFIGAQVLAHRQVQLFSIGRNRASFVAALGFSWIGIASLVWLLDEPTGPAVWAAHVFDGLGVLAAAAGLIIVHRRDRNLTGVLAPVLNRDPIVALRLGITPEIRNFVSMLDAKDRSTAGHVTRVAELAMRLGERSAISGARLRNLGLAALLHDIGKVQVPTEILTKPARLTDDEFNIMKQHTIWGEAMLASDPMLSQVAPLVRSHHERVDGRGYPDGLRRQQIPLDVSLIAVADAWDAMVQTRHYRVGMSDQQARAIFSRHAGTQWSGEAVDLLFAQIDHGGLDGVFDDIGADHHICADALDGLPATISLIGHEPLADDRPLSPLLTVSLE